MFVHMHIEIMFFYSDTEQVQVLRRLFLILSTNKELAAWILNLFEFILMLIAYSVYTVNIDFTGCLLFAIW